MADPTYPAFPIFAFISFVLVLIPLPWHLQAWNSGTCLLMIWTAIGCLNQFVNSIVWHNNALDIAPAWCDLSSRINVALGVAIPASCLCISRRLYNIAACQTANITKAHKRRAVIIDLCIGLGIPLLQIPLQFVVQGHRYNILEDIGCYPTTYNTWLAYPLVYVWPNVIGLVSLTYAVLTLHEFMKRRAQFAQFLSSNTSLNANRYFRLMLLATMEILFNTPISAYGLYLNTQTTIHPWISWEESHFDWYIVDKYPSVLWRSNRQAAVTVELSRWSLVACALIFFAFFGFAEEARKNYRLAFWAIAKHFGKYPPLPPSKVAPAGRGPILPLTLPHMSSVKPPAYTPRPPPPPSSVPSDVDSSSLYLSPTIPDYKIDIDIDAMHSTPSTPSSSYSTSTTRHLSAHDDDEKYPITIPQAVAL